jgi:RNA polymerase sigma-70 factor (ECF subfamily)
VNDDAQLVAATLAGDKSAYGRLVERYQDRLTNAVTRFLGSREDARDVVQDAFVQAYLKLDSFRGASAFYTWLYRIAFNLAMSHARRCRAMYSLDGAHDGQGSEPMDHAEGPDGAVLRGERATLVHAALMKLDDEFRQVVVLRELDGSSYEEIAEILSVPIGTVRSRLFRARMQLRERLAPILEEETAHEIRPSKAAT